MSKDAVVYVVVALAIALAALVLLTFVFFQRRRQRAMLLLALAQEDAERRRRKKRKVALRRWEIDHAAPERLVYRVAAQPAQHTLTLQANPAQYADAITSLRAAGSLPPDPPHRQPSLHPPVTKPPPTSNDSVTTAAELPKILVAIPPAESSCVICLEPIAVGHTIRTLPCDHIYHSQCIRIWLRRKNACPCCCHRVFNRKRKRSNNHLSLTMGADRPVSLQPTRPPRLNDRGENNSLHNTMSRDKSSFLSRQSDDTSLDRFNSDTTIQMDEHATAELLSQVRSALRGQSSLLSLGTSSSVAPSDTLASQRFLLDTLPNPSHAPGSTDQRPEHTTLSCGDATDAPPSSSHHLASAPLDMAPNEREPPLDFEAITPAPPPSETITSEALGNT